MDHEAVYRLGEYRITEYQNSLLLWERHASLGMQYGGKCFVVGNVLVIGHCDREEHGYLKLEFQEQLDKLPTWDKTDYYCFASDLLDVATGHNITDDLLRRMGMKLESIGKGPDPRKEIKAGNFRLERYLIIVDPQDRVSWKTYEGVDRIAGGRAIIESGILFIGSQEYLEEDQSKHEFLNELDQLMNWDNTGVWSRSLNLLPCGPVARSGPVYNLAASREKKISHFEEKISWRPKSLPGNQVENLFGEGIGRLRTWWQGIHISKSLFSHLKFLAVVAAAIFFVFAVVLYSVREKKHLKHFFKDGHHDKHDHEKD